MDQYSDPRAVVATLNAVWEAGDLDTTLSMFAEDALFVVHATPEGTQHAGLWEGREQIRGALIYLRTLLEYILYRPRIVSADGNRVYVTIEFKSRHRPSGERLDFRFRQEFTVEHGMITRCDEFHDAAMLTAFMRMFAPGSGP
jgi:ketosteroid isomerase-like protein